MDCQPVYVLSSTAADSTVGTYCREENVALGTIGFDDAVTAMMTTIRSHLYPIEARSGTTSLACLGGPPTTNMVVSRNEYLGFVATREERDPDGASGPH